MNGSDDSMVKIIQSLGLDYKPAEQSIKSFEARIASLNKQLFNMKANAIQGARDINQAFSSQLGSLGGGKVLVDQWGQPLKTIQTEAAKVGTGVVAGFTPATEALKGHGQAVQDVAKQYNIFGSEMQRRVSWFMTGGLFYGTLKAARETVQTISEVEMGMIEIARIMDDSSFVFKEYRDELLQLGVQYGQTFNTVQDIAVKWAQAGYNAKDSLELTKTALLALNTAELDATYATQGLIAVMAQWGLTSEELLPVLDKINKTADDFAITSQDIIDGITRSGAAAKNMNLTLDETIGVITVLRESSGRTGREVGNAFNTILSYIQRASSINIMERMGIRVFADEARTQFVSILDLFEQMAKKWNDPSVSDALKTQFEQAANEAGIFNEELAVAVGLQDEYNDLQKRDLAQSAAGVRRRNYFISLMERFNQVQEVTNNMMDAAGYSMRENDRTMEGLAKKYNSLKAAAQELAVALGDAGLLDALKSIVDVGTNAAHAIAQMDEDSRAFLLTALELTSAVVALNSITRLFADKTLVAAIGGVMKLIPGWGQVAAVIAAVAGAIGLLTYNMKQANAQTAEDISAKQKQLEETNNLINSYEVLEGKADKTNDVKDRMLEIQKQLAAIYPDYVDSLDDEGNKLITNVELLREVVALKREELELKRQDAIADARRKIPSLIRQREQLQRKMEESQQRLDTGDTLVTIEEQGQRFVFDERNKIRKDLLDLQQQRFKLDQEIKSLSQVMSSGIDYVDYERWLPKTPTGGGVVDDGVYEQGAVGVTGTSAATNEALRNALRVLEHRKRMNQISIADEIEHLNNIRNLYITNADELMDINERIYDAQNRLIDSTFKNSTDWINERKSLGLMSAAEEIEAWERVYKNQKDNAEAQKQATINLYKLRNQVMVESFNMEERSIKHLSKLGIYSIEQQIEKYRELYTVKAKDLAEEQARIENLFELYKKLISDQQKTIKTAHDKRIEQIEKEAHKKKEVNEAEIKAIEAELDLLNKREQAYDHDKRMANLKEELAYWQVRTSEQARQKVADILKQIDEEEHNREVELKKQGLEDKKKVLQDEIKSIDDTAKKEREKWEKSYKQIEIRFDDHSINMIALASAMSKGMFDEFKRNYLDKIEDAIKSGDYDSIGGILDGVDDYAEEARRKTYDSTNAQVYRLASQILDFKRQYEYGGDTSAAQMAKSYYDELSRLSPNVADMLHRSNYMTAKKYVESLPRAHSGGKTLSYGAVYMKPGELIFPPDLSIKLDGLLDFLKASPAYRSSANSYAYDNSKRVNIDKLLNIERNYNEDKTDIEIWARELRRAVIAI